MTETTKKRFICDNGHKFDMPLTQGEEWTETDVCPVCKTDKFEFNNDKGTINEPRRDS